MLARKTVFAFAFAPLAVGCAISAKDDTGSTNESYSWVIPPDLQCSATNMVTTPPPEWWARGRKIVDPTQPQAMVEINDGGSSTGASPHDFIVVDVSTGAVVRRELVTDAQLDDFLAINPTNLCVPSGNAPTTTPPPPPPPPWKYAPPGCVDRYWRDFAVTYYCGAGSHPSGGGGGGGGIGHIHL